MTSLFLPHGAPDLPLTHIPAAQFLRGFAARRNRPKGIIIVSAHWETHGLHYTSAGNPDTIYDFGGFPPELYRLTYPARTSRDLLGALADCLRTAGYDANADPHRGFDHGVWVPLLLAYPEVDIPVVQLSLDRTMTPENLFALGMALGPLSGRGFLVIGSGATVHNLRRLGPEGSPIPDWAREFDTWLEDVLVTSDIEALTDPERAPGFKRAHPTPEHFLPLIVAAGAGMTTSNLSARQLHKSYSYASISMSAWEFGVPMDGDVNTL